MRYLAVLDYDHLDNGIFLSAFARSLSRQKGVHPIIVHGDSDYTERVIQTGVMREEARIRSIKDLNHRLIALLADEGVSTIGINGYQRDFITLKEGELKLDSSYFERLPHQPALLLSSLAADASTGQPTPVPLTNFVRFLKKTLDAEELFIFSHADADEVLIDQEKPSEMKWEKLNTHFLETYIPPAFHHFGETLRLTTAAEFHRIPELSRTTLIR